MGDRGQIKMQESGVYLYTHWGGSELKKDLKNALNRKERWGDEEYLTRIIFDSMSSGQQGEETGFGIGTKKHGDIEYPILIVDCINKKVIEANEETDKVIKECSFDEFIEKTKERN